MPILQYGFGIICWTLAEMLGIDWKTQNITTQYKCHHPKSDTNHLYNSQKLGKRGITSATNCFQQKCTCHPNYLVDNTDNTLVEIVKKSEERTKIGLMAFANGLTLQETKKTMQYEQIKKMTQIPLTGNISNNHEISAIEIEQSNDWLQNSHLWFETESIICAA